MKYLRYHPSLLLSNSCANTFRMWDLVCLLLSLFSERDTYKKVLNFPVNHVLIQHYRSGADYISDHSDKTIDVIRNSSIANVSLGAQRIMTLRLKRNKRQQQQEGERQATTNTITALDKNPTTHIHQPPRLTQRIPLPNNSLFIMGLETNKKWLHGISPDKRPLSTLSPLEQIHQGSRISLTFKGSVRLSTPWMTRSGVREHEARNAKMRENTSSSWIKHHHHQKTTIKWSNSKSWYGLLVKRIKTLNLIGIGGMAKDPMSWISRQKIKYERTKLFESG